MPEPPPPGSDDALPLRVADLDWHSTLVLLAAFVALLALTGAVRAAPHAISVLIVGSLLALALNPLVSAVQRRIGGHRAPAVLIVLLGLTVALAALVAVLGPPAVRQARQLSDQAPRVVQQLGDLPIVGHRLQEANAPEKVQHWIEGLPDRLSNDTSRIARTGGLVVDGFVTTMLTLLVTVGLMLDGERLARRIGRAIPARRRIQVNRIANLAYGVVGRYVAGSLLVAAIAGVAILIVGLTLGVPLTPLLAVWVALFDLVPQIGGAVGGIPFVALGFARSPTVGVMCAIFFVLYLNFENHVLQPLIIGRAVHLSPPATMIAALVGVSALGVVGGLIAVPTVGAAKAIYLELWAPPPDAAPVESHRLHLARPLRRHKE